MARLKIVLATLAVGTLGAVMVALIGDWTEQVVQGAFEASPIIRYAAYALVFVVLLVAAVGAMVLIALMVRERLRPRPASVIAFGPLIQTTRNDPKNRVLASCPAVGLVIFARQEAQGWLLSYKRVGPDGVAQDARLVISELTVIFGVTPARHFVETLAFSFHRAFSAAAMPYVTPAITAAISVRSGLRGQANREAVDLISKLTSTAIAERRPQLDASERDKIKDVTGVVKIVGTIELDDSPAKPSVQFQPEISTIWSMDYILLMTALFKRVRPDAEGRRSLQMRIWNPFEDWKDVDGG